MGPSIKVVAWNSMPPDRMLLISPASDEEIEQSGGDWGKLIDIMIRARKISCMALVPVAETPKGDSRGG